MGLELTTFVVIGTDCIGSCISNYHAFMTMTAPQFDKCIWGLLFSIIFDIFTRIMYVLCVYLCVKIDFYVLKYKYQLYLNEVLWLFDCNQVYIEWLLSSNLKKKKHLCTACLYIQVIWQCTIVCLNITKKYRLYM